MEENKNQEVVEETVEETTQAEETVDAENADAENVEAEAVETEAEDGDKVEVEEAAEPTKEKSKLFKKKKDPKDEKIEELSDKLLRQMAEFDNFRKRTEKEKSAMYEIGAKDIVLPAIKETENRFAYLCVFDPQGWTPVAWAEVEGDSLRFKSVGPNIVYHLAYYEKDALVLSGHPFLLDTSGHVTHYIPTGERRSMELYRKHPESESLKFIPGRVKGGRFQGADNPRFLNAEDLYVIADEPLFKYVGVSVEGSRPYKYYRYLTSDECNGNMAEVEFYAPGNDRPLQGKAIGDYEPSIYYPRNTADRMFDGDALTFFHNLYL